MFPQTFQKQSQLLLYSASEVTTIWRYTNVYIIIIIIISCLISNQTCSGHGDVYA